MVIPTRNSTFFNESLQKTTKESHPYVFGNIFNIIVLKVFFPLHQVSRKFPTYQFLGNRPIKELLKVQTSFLKIASRQFDSLHCT